MHFAIGCSKPTDFSNEPPLTASPKIQTTPKKLETDKTLDSPKSTQQFSNKDLSATRDKVKKLIKQGKARWLLHGEATDNALMCFLVLQSSWSSFTEREKFALRPIIEEKIVELKSNPAKYTNTKEGAPLWYFVVDKLQNTKAAVMISNRKDEHGDFEVSKEIVDFDKPGNSEVPTKPQTSQEPIMASLDQELMSAVSSENVSKVRQLLKKGANPNATWDSNGLPAIVSAAINGNLQIVKILVSKGANVNQTDTSLGWTALQHAQNELKHEEDNPSKYKAVIRYLSSK